MSASRAASLNGGSGGRITDRLRHDDERRGGVRRIRRSARMADLGQGSRTRAGATKVLCGSRYRPRPSIAIWSLPSLPATAPSRLCFLAAACSADGSMRERGSGSTCTRPIGASGGKIDEAPTAVTHIRNRILKRDELSLNRHLIPFVPRKRGPSSLAEFSAPGFPLSRERTEIGSMAAQTQIYPALAVWPRRAARYRGRQIDHGLAVQALKEIEAAAVGPRSAGQHRESA